MSRLDAMEIYKAALTAVMPHTFMQRSIKNDLKALKCGNLEFSWAEIGKLYVAGAGKAAAAMAVETEKLLGDRISHGVIITKYDHQLPLLHIDCFEAGHPVPDENGLNATTHLIQYLQKATQNDLVLLLISGGASALLTDLPPSLSLTALQEANRLLIQCGATIHEINTIRKHLSLIKGGQFLKNVNGATVVALLMSDVPGDDLSIIASGPTTPDSSTYKDAWAILEKYRLIEKAPKEITCWLRDGLSGKIPETPKPGDDIFKRSHNLLVATNHMALEAAKIKAAALGYTPIIGDAQLQGEARIKATEFVDQLSGLVKKEPSCLLLGGETTVTVRGNGKGGRNQEFALAALCEINKLSGNIPVILSAGTDGSDGPTDATGAFADEGVISAMSALQLDPMEFLDNNDAYTFFNKTGGLIITGATQTNVMDIVIGLSTSRK